MNHIPLEVYKKDLSSHIFSVSSVMQEWIRDPMLSLERVPGPYTLTTWLARGMRTIWTSAIIMASECITVAIVKTPE